MAILDRWTLDGITAYTKLLTFTPFINT